LSFSVSSHGHFALRHDVSTHRVQEISSDAFSCIWDELGKRTPLHQRVSKIFSNTEISFTPADF
jgi:hypothetical protein